MATEPFIGQLKLVTFNYAPVGWAFCNGQILSIGQNAALFSLLGTTYGGDGIETFALPDLRGRVPIHQTYGYPMGATGGMERVALTVDQMPSHAHWVNVAGVATTSFPKQELLAPAGAGNCYGPIANAVAPNGTVAALGNNAVHENRQPCLALYYIIALVGVYPSQS